MKPTKVPTQPVQKRIANFHEVELGFSKKVAVEEARKFPQSHTPSCQPKCPLGVDILDFIRLLREGDFFEAYKKIREENDLPAVCGRICLAPCEEEFVVAGKKMPIDVRALERFAADHGRPKFFGREKLTCAKERVAVIGSGPAGLSAAALLAREYYCVTVFESLPVLGGVLRYGIPEFRLSQGVLDAEISQIRDLGVEFQTNVTVGQTVTCEQLFDQGFAAVLLAAGRSRPRFLDIPGTDAAGVFYAQEILLKLNFSEAVFEREFGQGLGHQVVVIGSQGMALDCARACRRLGKEVALVFPGTEADVDIHRNEVAYAKEEGVGFQAMLQPAAVELGAEGQVKGLRCVRMDFADKKGQWVLVPVPGTETVLPADAVIVAQGSDVNPLVRRMLPGLKCNPDQTLWIDAETGETSVPKVFATGDLVDARGRVLDAMVSGKWAAEKIIKCLTVGRDLPASA